MKAWMALKRSTTKPRVGNWQLPYEISWLARESGKIFCRRSVWNRVKDAPVKVRRRTHWGLAVEERKQGFRTSDGRSPNSCFGSTSPIRRSSSWRTSTASLMLASGSVRVSQALRMELGVISENFALRTCKLGLTREKQTHAVISSDYHLLAPVVTDAHLRKFC